MRFAGSTRFILAILALAASTRLGRCDTFLIKSTDGGRSWADIDPGPPHLYVVGLKQDAASTLYALTGDRDPVDQYRVLASSDRGRSWRTLDRLTTGGGVMGWAVDPVNPGTIYIARAKGPELTVLMTSDGGNTVAERLAGPLWPLGPSPFGDFVVDSRTPSTLYRAGGLCVSPGSPNCETQTGLLKSVDGGRNWTPLLSRPVNRIWLDPSDPRILYVLASRAERNLELLKSIDGGNSWSSKLDDVRSFFRTFKQSYDRFSDSLAMDPRAPAVLVAARNDGSIWKSTDGAASWRRLNPSASFDPGWSFRAEGVYIGPGNPSVIFSRGSVFRFSESTGEILLTGLKMLKSEDGGASWAPLLEGELARFSFQFDSAVSATVYGVSGGRLEPRLHPRQAFVRDLIGRKRIAPGAIVSIYGLDFARETGSAASTPLPDSLLGASVRFQGRPAPLFFVSPGQMNAQVPFGLAEGPALVEVHSADRTSDRQTVQVEAFAPVILPGDYRFAPMIFHSDFRRVTIADPAKPREVIILYAAGLGDLERPLAAGAIPPVPPPQLARPFEVRLRCFEFVANEACHLADLDVPRTFAARTLWAGVAPGLVGVYQVNVELPAELSPIPHWLYVLTNAGLEAGVRLEVR